MSVSTATPPVFVQLVEQDEAALLEELQQGLMAAAAVVAPKFLYSPLGSSLFEAITWLDEYYPTRTEAAIFAAERDAIAAACGTGRPLVDLGAADCRKGAALFDVLKPSQYVAVDISAEFVRDALTALQQRHPELPMVGVGMDFSNCLHLPDLVAPGPRTLFYPGSSIGNFTPEQALAFLRRAHLASAGGTLLIGVDLLKPREVLEPAYDDALGVTAAFNLNLLRNVNARLGSDFDPRQWRHVACFNEQASRVEMHLEARAPVLARWAGGQRAFAAGERLHTESSYKYRRGDFESLLHDAGFRRVQCLTDARGWFAVFAAQA